MGHSNAEGDGHGTDGSNARGDRGLALDGSMSDLRWMHTAAASAECMHTAATRELHNSLDAQAPSQPVSKPVGSSYTAAALPLVSASVLPSAAPASKAGAARQLHVSADPLLSTRTPRRPPVGLTTYHVPLRAQRNAPSRSPRSQSPRSTRPGPYTPSPPPGIPRRKSDNALSRSSMRDRDRIDRSKDPEPGPGPLRRRLRDAHIHAIDSARNDHHAMVMTQRKSDNDLMGLVRPTPLPGVPRRKSDNALSEHMRTMSMTHNASDHDPVDPQRQDWIDRSTDPGESLGTVSRRLRDTTLDTIDDALNDRQTMAMPRRKSNNNIMDLMRPTPTQGIPQSARRKSDNALSESNKTTITHNAFARDLVDNIKSPNRSHYFYDSDKNWVQMRTTFEDGFQDAPEVDSPGVGPGDSHWPTGDEVDIPGSGPGASHSPADDYQAQLANKRNEFREWSRFLAGVQGTSEGEHDDTLIGFDPYMEDEWLVGEEGAAGCEDGEASSKRRLAEERREGSPTLPYRSLDEKPDAHVTKFSGFSSSEAIDEGALWIDEEGGE